MIYTIQKPIPTIPGIILLVTSGDSMRVERGGGWYFNPRFVRAANRDPVVPDGKSYSLGVSLCLPQSGD